MLPTLLPASFNSSPSHEFFGPGWLALGVGLLLAIVVMVRGGFLLNSSDREAQRVGTTLVVIGGLVMTVWIVGVMLLH